MTQRHRAPARLLAAGLVAAGLLVAACGDDDASTDTTAAAAETTAAAVETTAAAETTAPAAETTAPAAETTAAPAEGLASADALARVEAFRQPVTELPFSTPVAAEAGKKVFYVQCGVAVCAEIAVGIEAAAAAAGWTYETASHQDTPDTVASAFDAAIAAGADVILTSGNPREWFASQLATLKDSGIPVIAWSLPEGYEPGDGIAANLLTQDDYYFYGVLMADYAAATTVTGNIHFVGLPTFPVLSIVQQGFTDEIAKACPTCTVEVSEVAVTDIGTNLPGQITSALQANPDLDMIVYAFGGMLYGVPDALDAAGLVNQAKAVSQAGGPLNFGFIANDQHQVAEVALASELLGWRAIDAAARVLAGEGPGRAETPANAVVDGHPDILSGGLPLQILEKGSIADPSALWIGVEGFQDQFKALWGV
jgi:ribose transport system substrate-binding protein